MRSDLGHTKSFIIILHFIISGYFGFVCVNVATHPSLIFVMLLIRVLMPVVRPMYANAERKVFRCDL